MKKIACTKIVPFGHFHMRYYYYCCTVLLSITPSKMISIPPSISVGKETYDIKCLIFKINVSYI